MGKIITSYNICLFCGKEKKGKWEEYEKYYECDCEDAVKDRQIDEQIKKLIRQRPKHKYQIEECRILVKIN